MLSREIITAPEVMENCYNVLQNLLAMEFKFCITRSPKKFVIMTSALFCTFFFKLYIIVC